MQATLERCELGGLLSSNDGGVAQVAKRWLATHVAQQLTPPRTKARPKASQRGFAAVLALACIAIGFVVAIATLAGERAHERSGERPVGSANYQGGA